MRLANKVALITGAAGGLGAATVRRFAAEGARVVMADVLDDEGQALADDLRRGSQGPAACQGDCHSPVDVSFLRLDVSSPTDWQSAIEHILTRHGRLDILVNNAGVSGVGYDDNTDVAAWHKLIDINATGVFHGLKYGVPPMIAAGGGSVVNLSSVSALAGQRGMHFGYSASKGAILSMTKLAAVQYGPGNVRVNSVHPGLLPPMRRANPAGPAAARDQMLARIPLGRAGEAVDVANAVLYLASDEAAYVTGAELYVDGGFLAG